MLQIQQSEDFGGEQRHFCRLDYGVVWPMRGFTLVEMMIALLVLTSGLLAVGQMLFVAAASGSLSRSKESAAIAAQDRLESLANLYRKDPSAEDLKPGSHGPQQVEVINPIDETALNLFNVLWNVESVSDGRPGKVLEAKLVRVTIVPALPSGEANSKPGLNKTLNVSTILSPRMRWHL
jgi:prepilin-type N-terminal cleavage/methylation domain-containing protein